MTTQPLRAIFVFSLITGLFILASLAANGGDGIFTAKISPVAAIDKTGHPMTVEVPQPEPSFAGIVAAGKPAGDSYVIHFPPPAGDVGGACVYTGNARYLIESNGVLTFQVIADCGKLKRGYSYMICMLNEDLRCSEAPWWYFRGRTYAITNEGLAVSNQAPYAWKDATDARQNLQKIAANIKQWRDRTANSANLQHSRMISCRDFHPEARTYETRVLSTTCAIKSACNSIPNVDSLRDGDPIGWNTPVGSYIKQQLKISDASDWACWLRTQ
ncbi:MAG TPA: hypothetical protein VKH15_17485 [Candidatus Acidoferrum sp.]|nr:hypothetical protein [Candidatus Acidoferrum sp.]